MDTSAKKISILGTEYTVRFVEAGQDEYMDKMHYGGYCSNDSHEIYILLLKTHEEWENEPEENIAHNQRTTLRHEIIHAFLNESGLQWNSFTPDSAWAKNEEMVDWIAIQFPKLLKAFEQADAL